MAFTFLNIKIDSEARSRNKVPRTRNVIEENVNIEFTVASSQFTALKFIKSTYNRGKFIRAITMKLFIEKCHIGRKWVTTDTEIQAWRSGLMNICFLPDVYDVWQRCQATDWVTIEWIDPVELVWIIVRRWFGFWFRIYRTLGRAALTRYLLKWLIIFVLVKYLFAIVIKYCFNLTLKS